MLSLEGIVRPHGLVHQGQELYEAVLVCWRQGAEGVLVEDGAHVDAGQDGVRRLQVHVSLFGLCQLGSGRELALRPGHRDMGIKLLLHVYRTENNSSSGA